MAPSGVKLRIEGRTLMPFAFGHYVVDPERFELRRGPDIVEIEPQVFELLCVLIKNAERVVSQDEMFETVWGGRIVSTSTLTSRINAARVAIGDNGTEQKYIKTIPRKGYRFIGKLVEQRQGASEPSAKPHIARVAQEIRFCTSADSTRIAYAVSGTGPPLLKAANWMSHLEFDWDSPVWSHWIAALSRRHKLVRYDGRGNGLSDRKPDNLSLDAMVSDLEAVAAELGDGKFPLMAVGQGCSTAIAYAVRHPHRVSRLILYGGYIRGWRARADFREVAWRTALGTLIREGWGQETPAFRQIFTSLFLPGGSPEQMNWYNELQRMTVDPEMAEQLHHAFGDFDVSALLPKVKVPTLVMHAREDVICPFSAGLALAQGIPGARFVPLESSNHILLPDERAFSRLISELEGFASPVRELRAVVNR
jgi:DNA-binding winged helix-turn-helix (wHTH) protein/alpha-beta hydrolase superfamily lysophospholipase